MTDEDLRLALERLRSRMSLQEEKHKALEKTVETRLSKIEANTNRLVWLLLTFLIMSALSVLFGDQMELSRITSSANASTQTSASK